MKKKKKLKMTKNPFPGDIKKIRSGKYWVCLDCGTAQPKGRLNCVDCK